MLSAFYEVNSFKKASDSFHSRNETNHNFIEYLMIFAMWFIVYKYRVNEMFSIRERNVIYIRNILSGIIIVSLWYLAF